MATPKKVKTITINSTKYAVGGGGEGLVLSICPDFYGTPYVSFQKGDQLSYQMTAAELAELAKNSSFIEVYFGNCGMRYSDDYWKGGFGTNGLIKQTTHINYIDTGTPPAKIGFGIEAPYMRIGFMINEGDDPMDYSNWNIEYYGGYSSMGPVMFRLHDNTDLSSAGTVYLGFGSCVYVDPSAPPGTEPETGNAMDTYALIAAAKTGAPITISGKNITDAAGVAHDYITMNADSIEYNETAETVVIRFRSAGIDKTLTKSVSGMPSSISSMTLA